MLLVLLARALFKFVIEAATEVEAACIVTIRVLAVLAMLVAELRGAVLALALPAIEEIDEEKDVD